MVGFYVVLNIQFFWSYRHVKNMFGSVTCPEAYKGSCEEMRVQWVPAEAGVPWEGKSRALFGLPSPPHILDASAGAQVPLFPESATVGPTCGFGWGCLCK